MSDLSSVIPANAGTQVIPDAGTRKLGPGGRRDETAKVARQFEALIVAQMLRAARNAALADDPLRSQGSATYTDMIDAARAQQLAATGPLGVARLLVK